MTTQKLLEEFEKDLQRFDKNFNIIEKNWNNNAPWIVSTEKLYGFQLKIEGARILADNIICTVILKTPKISKADKKQCNEIMGQYEQFNTAAIELYNAYRCRDE